MQNPFHKQNAATREKNCERIIFTQIATLYSFINRDRIEKTVSGQIHPAWDPLRWKKGEERKKKSSARQWQTRTYMVCSL